MSNSEELDLGWKVDDDFHPTYWIKENPKQGSQTSDDLVRINAETMDSHTVIIAQSGSGKSFFLGRLVEELLLHTKGRCLVFDPNGDFYLAHKVKEDVWKDEDPKYDKEKGMGLLSHEENGEEFKKKWNGIEKRIRTTSPRNDTPDEVLKIWWPSISAEFLSEGLNVFERSKIFHCHEFVKAIADLINYDAVFNDKEIDIIEKCENYASLFLRKDSSGFNEQLEKEFGWLKKSPDIKEDTESFSMFKSMDKYLVTIKAKKSFAKANSSIKYCTKDIIDYYFGIAKQYKSDEIIEDAPGSFGKDKLPQLDIVNLPSISSTNTKILIINSILKNEMKRAKILWENEMKKTNDEIDKRTPVFIVVEEAHNLIPADSENKLFLSIREQFRTIAAEGRKFGLFLIIVSQRPDKLDPLIVSECKNKAIMKLDSQEIIEIVKKKLGLESITLLNETLKFKKGRILFVGKWVDEPVIAYGASRRTIPGGRDLKPEYWANSK